MGKLPSSFGSKVGGKNCGRSTPCLTATTRCIAIQNSSRFKAKSLSRSDKCLNNNNNFNNKTKRKDGRDNVAASYYGYNNNNNNNNTKNKMLENITNSY